MTRAIAQAQRDEYEALKAFYFFWERHLTPFKVFPLSDPRHPINVLTWIEQTHGISKAMVGLRQAVADVLESVCELTPDFVAQADVALRSANILTLTALVQRSSRRFKALLRRGKIGTATDYYFVSALLGDTTSNLTEAERDCLGLMIGAFEAQRA